MAEVDRDLFRIYCSVRAYAGHDIALANVLHFYEEPSPEAQSLTAMVLEAVDRSRRSEPYQPPQGHC